MKTLVFIFVSIALSYTTLAQTSEAASISVTIDNVMNDNGKVMISLHTEDTFMKGQGVQSLESSIENGTVTVTFTDVAPGTYAIMALHDENENGRMDFESNGMPIESYGISGNIMSVGPPTYADAKFDVAHKDLDLSIRF